MDDKRKEELKQRPVTMYDLMRLAYLSVRRYNEVVDRLGVLEDERQLAIQLREVTNEICAELLRE